LGSFTTDDPLPGGIGWCRCGSAGDGSLRQLHGSEAGAMLVKVFCQNWMFYQRQKNFSLWQKIKAFENKPQSLLPNIYTKSQSI